MHTHSLRLRPFILAYLLQPYLWIMAGMLVVMVALSFEHDRLHSIAMRLRWPALGGAACVGALLLAFVPVGRLRAAQWSMLAFLVVAMASSAYSIDRMYSFQRAVSIGLLFVATMVGLYAYCRRLDRAQSMTDLLWCLGTCLVCAGLVYRSGNLLEGRYGGLHSRATGAGTYAALFLPIAVYQVRYRLTGLLHLFGWLVVGLCFVQPVFAGARAAAGISAVVLVFLSWEYYGKKAAIAVIILGMLAPIPFLVKRGLTDTIGSQSERLLRKKSLTTFTGRADRWMFGIEQFRKKPIFGHGLGASRTLAGNEDPRRFKLQPGEVFNLHSDQIEVLMDTGIVGYLPFAAFWISIVAAGIWIILQPVSPQRQLALAYLGSVFYAFIDTFMHGGFLAAGGGVAAYSWSMIAVFLAVLPATSKPITLFRRRKSSLAHQPAQRRRPAWLDPFPTDEATQQEKLRLSLQQRRLRQQLPTVKQVHDRPLAETTINAGD